MFDNQPPTDHKKAFQILRVAAASRVDVTIISREFRGVGTHWTGKENKVCDRPNPCKLCDRGEQRRWNGYIAVQSETTQTRAILHFTPPVAEYLKAYSHRPPFLLGLEVTIQRCGVLNNGKLVISKRGVNQDVTELSIEDLEWQVSRLFNKASWSALKIASEA